MFLNSNSPSTCSLSAVAVHLATQSSPSSRSVSGGDATRVHRSTGSPKTCIRGWSRTNRGPAVPLASARMFLKTFSRKALRRRRSSLHPEFRSGLSTEISLRRQIISCAERERVRYGKYIISNRKIVQLRESAGSLHPPDRPTRRSFKVSSTPVGSHSTRDTASRAGISPCASQ